MFAKLTDGKEIYETLSKQNIRIFHIQLTGVSKHFKDNYLIHKSKTISEWRQDINNFLNLNSINKNSKDYLNANDELSSKLLTYLEDLDYVMLYEVIADVFEAKIQSIESEIIPSNEDHSIEGFNKFRLC